MSAPVPISESRGSGMRYEGGTPLNSGLHLSNEIPQLVGERMSQTNLPSKTHISYIQIVNRA
jgi:hypothetical protein